jgi:hypothetical protein
MTKFFKFDRTNLKALRAEMEVLLSKYGVESNIELSVGNMKFSAAEVEIKVEAKIIGEKTLTNALLESRVASLGLKIKNKFGDELVDYNPRAYKMPFIYINWRDGKRYKCSEESVKLRFAA